jgi:hypothetical protein
MANSFANVRTRIFIMELSSSVFELAKMDLGEQQQL